MKMQAAKDGFLHFATFRAMFRASFVNCAGQLHAKTKEEVLA